MLTACVAGPNFVTPKSPAADRYTTEELPNVALPANGTRAEVPELWWTLFQSPKLNDTVQTALARQSQFAGGAGNPETGAGAARCRQAANRMPDVSAEASNGRQKLGAAFLGGFNLPPFTYYSIGASVSYMFGLAGGMTRTVEQSAALAEAQQHELDAAHLSLTGNVVLQSSGDCLCACADSSRLRRCSKKIVAMSSWFAKPSRRARFRDSMC